MRSRRKTENVFDSIPGEIMEEISSYLDYNDIKFIRRVSRLSNLMIHSKFVRASWFKIDSKLTESNNIEFIREVQNNIQFKNIKFEDIDFTKLNKEISNQFWPLFTDTVESLSIDGGRMDDGELLMRLDAMPNLKYLHIHLKSDYNLCDLISSVMNRVIELTIEKCPPQKENAIRQKYVTLMKNSKSNLIKLNIDFKSSTTMLFILPGMHELFQKLTTSLDQLHVNSYFTLSKINNLRTEELENFNKINFNLTSLKFRIWAGLNYDILENCAKKIKNLKHLDVTWFGVLTENHKLIIHEHLKNLETFKFKTEDSGQPNYTKLDFTMFENIKTLEIDERTSKITEIQFSSASQKTLKSLSLRCDYTENVIKTIFTNLINLKELSLKNYDRDFPTKHLTLMFNNLQHLEVLTIRAHPNRNEYLDDKYEVNVNVGLLQKLRSIDLVGIKNCRSMSFWHLANVPGIERIRYYHSGKVSKGNVIEVLERCPKIKQIHLNDHIQYITPEDEVELCLIHFAKDLKLRSAVRCEN